MSTSNTVLDWDLLDKIALLPDGAKQEVVVLVDKLLSEAPPPKSKFRRGGWAKGKFNIVIHDDFDEPLEDFREYME